MRRPVCIVDDDASVREAVGSLLRSAGLTVETFGSAREFLASPRRDAPSCLVLDVELPGLSGLDLQQELVKGNVRVPIIFLTGHGDIPMSVRAIKAGALDFLTKPVDVDQLLGAIEKGIAQDHGAAQSARAALQRAPEHGGVIGTSQSWREVLEQAAKVAPTETTVLLSGESGTGKEVVAHLIHRGSRRAEGAFVALNCAALPETLLESELFGYEKGAFTGAVVAHAGRLEQAAGGTLFLDEVGEMSPAVQAKFLRVLEEREFQRLGGTRLLKADVRVIAVARAPGGYPAPARALRRGARAGGAGAAGGGDFARRARAFPGPRLAGQRARAAQRGGARADSVRGGPDQSRAPALARRGGAERNPTSPDLPPARLTRPGRPIGR